MRLQRAALGPIAIRDPSAIRTAVPVRGRMRYHLRNIAIGGANRVELAKYYVYFE